MPIYPRNFSQTIFFHVITQGINKEYIFDKPEDIKYYIKNMYRLKEKLDVQIIAYCIMNNHAHILIKTNNIHELGKYMQCLNTKYGKYYNKKYNRIGYVFRDRYKSEGIYSEKQLYNCIQYIYNNPVKAGICVKPEEYPYSNYRKMNGQVSQEFIFLDIEEDREDLIKQVIERFLMCNKLKLKDLQKERGKLTELICILRDKYKMSFRKISEELEIGRERIRRNYNCK